MYKNKSSTLKTILFLLLFGPAFGFFTESVQAQNDPELIAKNLVENGQYNKAIPYFEDLVRLYPKDKVLNYYLGMCLAETEQFSKETKKALEISLGENTPVKSLYCLGQYYHAQSDFSQAIKYYQQFDDKARRRDKRDTQLDELMKQAREKINPFPQPIVQKAPKPKEEETQSTTTDTSKIATAQPDSAITAPPKVVAIPEILKDTIINFQVNSSIKYLKASQFQKQASLQAFIKAWKGEQELQELLDKTNQLRETYDSAQAGPKADLANQILELEKQQYAKHQSINKNYNQARMLENRYWQTANPDSVNAFTDRIHTMEDSIHQAKETVRINQLEAEKPKVLPDSLAKTLLPEKPQTIDNGITYKIQIGAYSKTPPDWVQRLFKKLSVIRKIDHYTDDNGVTVYTVGELKSYDDALQMQSQVRLEGVKDAFIAAYKNGERIPVKEARKLSKE
ncbi:MAG TPA: tetratricopeptide repeat protein [Sunxiuqinia sp.]|nr:tetratricopeptide repeat protein [Sunxiuqinia sp.]